MNFFGYFAGSLLAGVLMEGLGFHILFFVVAVINAVCVFFTIGVMRESVNIEGAIEDGKIKVRDKQNEVILLLYSF